MKAHKTARPARLAALVLVLSVCPAANENWAMANPSPESPRAGTRPEVRAVDQRFLTQLVRRTLMAGAQKEQSYAPAYVPPLLVDQVCQVVVTLRQNGRPRGIGISTRKSIVAACLEAAEFAGRSLEVDGLFNTTFLRTVRIDIEAIGEPVAYKGHLNWTEPGVVDAFIDPGRDGVQLNLDGNMKWFTPAEAIAKNLPLDEGLRTLRKEVTINPEALPDATLSKFQTLHWWEADASGRTVCLRRGVVPLGADAVTRSNLDEAIGRLARYMLYRQRPDGSFAREYNPAADLYSEKESPLAQSGAAWAMAVYARHTGKGGFRRAADKAIDAILERMVDLPTIDGAGFIASPDGRNRLGTTALFALALADGPDPDRFADKRQRLTRAMLWLQLDSGKVVTAFPPADMLATQEVFPGQALLALARAYEMKPSREILDLFDRALGFYREFFRKERPAGLIPWQGRAFGAMYRLTKKQAYADFVFEMNDGLCTRQLTPDNCRAEELWGGVSIRSGVLPGISTAAYVQGFADAASLAREMGDTQRYQRYAAACRLGARFVMQLQFKPDECYYVQSPRDTVDGIRLSPIDGRIRINSCQDALIALIKTRQLLFPDEK